MDKHKTVGWKVIFETDFLLSHFLISIIIDIFDLLRCFIDILHKYNFHDERVFFVNQTYITTTTDKIFEKQRIP